MSVSKQHFHLRSSSWDGGGGLTVGEEADGGVEGDRLQDIFCKLFQVRKRLKTLVRTSQVSDCIQFSCILRGVALFLFALINHGGARKVRQDLIISRIYKFTTRNYFVILLPIFIVLVIYSHRYPGRLHSMGLPCDGRLWLDRGHFSLRQWPCLQRHHSHTVTIITFWVLDMTIVTT